jgi:hypothetical protein
VRFTWEWTGTPGTAPGGSLYWEHDGTGHGDAKGGTQDQAQSFAVAYSRTWVYVDVPPYPLSKAAGTVWGYVTNDNLATGEASVDGDPEVTATPIEDPEDGSYHYAIDWSIYCDDTTSVPSGTSYFYVQAQADCDCRAFSKSTGPGEAWTETESNASILAYAEFTSN